MNNISEEEELRSDVVTYDYKRNINELSDADVASMYDTNVREYNESDYDEELDDEGSIRFEDIHKVANGEDLYKFLEDNTMKIISNVDDLKNFLVKAALMDKSYYSYEIENIILIYSQLPEARFVYPKDKWDSWSIAVKENEAPLLLLYGLDKLDKDKLDPSILQIYGVFDIAQVYGSMPEPRLKFRDTGEAAEKVIRISPCKLAPNKVSKASMSYACYDPDNNLIMYSQGCPDYDTIFADFITEYVHYYIFKKNEAQFLAENSDNNINKRYIYNRNKQEYLADLTTYVICMLYDVKPGLNDVKQTPESWNDRVSTYHYRKVLKNIIEIVGIIDQKLQRIIYDDSLSEK